MRHNFYLGDDSWLSWKLGGGTQFSIRTSQQDHKKEGEAQVGLRRDWNTGALLKEKSNTGDKPRFSGLSKGMREVPGGP